MKFKKTAKNERKIIPISDFSHLEILEQKFFEKSILQKNSP